MSAAHLSSGTEEGLTSFNLSKYTVHYAEGKLTIGCKTYPAAGILDTLHKLLVEKQQTTTFFTASPEGPMHGKFGVTWEDAQKLYDALRKVRF